MRTPRLAELALMRTLLDGPKPVTAGPIGRCVKRGWCFILTNVQADSEGTKFVVLYGLTPSGRGLLGEVGRELAPTPAWKPAPSAILELQD